MGLLSRVIESQSTEIRSKKKSLIENFFSDLKSVETGFDFTKNIFQLLCSFLNIEKGALLILDKNTKVFMPGIFLNLDMTTSRHFRIESNFFNNHVDSFNKVVFREDQLLKGFKQFFSIREYSALNSLLIVPLYLLGILNAVLIIIDPDKNCAVSAKEITLSSEKIIKKIIKSRTPFNNMSTLSSDPVLKDPCNILETFIKSTTIDEYKFLLIIKLNVSDLIEDLIKHLHDTDTFSIYKDVIQAISKLCSSSGQLVKLSHEDYLIYYRLRAGTTPELIIHQIKLAVSAFFSIDNKLPDISDKYSIFNISTSNSPKSLLEGFI